MALIGGAICLLTWPFPRVEQGGHFTDALISTQLGFGVAVVAAVAAWLTDKRHPMFWAAEIVLVISIIAALVYRF